MRRTGRALRNGLRAFMAKESAGGIVLIAAAALAMLVANLPATAPAYAAMLHLTTGPVLAPTIGPMTVHLWINDGAMALFFLLVGLEIKRELVRGQLASWDQRRLPFIAAAAGMILPAIVYLAIVGDGAGLRRGWAIPAATDIAFAMGVMALIGRRVPAALTLLLATIAIVDDMGAVAIIALAYTDSIDLLALAGALTVTGALHLMRARGVMRLAPYLLLGALLWWLLLRSGVHATIAGVVLASAIPLGDDEDSPLERLEHRLHPWSAFVIVPLFAFANAGVPFATMPPGAWAAPLVLAVAAGLFLGKQAGILGSIWLAERLRIAARPAGVSWRHVHGLALIAGIGFTMSLFVGGLAFPGDGTLIAEVKLGVLAGSLLSAAAGAIVLLRAATGPDPEPV